MRRSAGLMLLACMAASVPAVAQTEEELRREVEVLRQRYEAQQNALMILEQRLRQLEGAASAAQPARQPPGRPQVANAGATGSAASGGSGARLEERRVGKDWRGRGAADQ